MSNASDFCPWYRLALPTFQFAFMWVDYMACTPWCLGSSTHQVSESFDQGFGFSVTQGLVSGHRLEHCNRLSQMRRTATLFLRGAPALFLRGNSQTAPKCSPGQSAQGFHTWGKGGPVLVMQQIHRAVVSMAVIQDSSVLPGGMGTYLPLVSVCARGSSLSPPEAGMTDGVCKGGCHMDRNVVGAEVGSRGSPRCQTLI